MKSSTEPLVEFDINSLTVYCHVFEGGIKSLCGVPRREQPPHAGWGWRGYPTPNFCPVDGLRVCPKCAELAR